MNIYVGNLPPETREDDLRHEFATFGQVKSVSLMNDFHIGSGQCRLCGFVEMVSKSEGLVAISRLQGRTINGHELSFIEALPVSRNSGNGVSGDIKPSGFTRKEARKRS